ncbi:MAG: hypothetical protein BWY83_01159 [bacterium ADurb.Bin478]|nr:MAG: hypothetical protein BWY83_01159 [bacterium ADurb.Bin478]
MFHKFDPTGRTGGQQRQALSALQSFDQLGRLFHNGQIRAKVGVKDRIESQAPQRCDRGAGHVGARLQVKAFADGGADRGRDLDHHMLARIRQRLPDGFGGIFLQKRSHRADVDALAAVDAHRFGHGRGKRRRHHCVKATEQLAEVVHRLDLGADAHTAAAEDAFFGVANHRRRGGPEPRRLGEPVAQDPMGCCLRRPSNSRSRTPRL